MNPDAYRDQLLSDAERIAACAASGPLDATVAACPGWSLADLVVHTGDVHRWATLAITTRERPHESDINVLDDRSDGAVLASWMRDGAAALVEALASVDATDDTWHPFLLEQKAWVWARRQAQETMMHRWDAEVAAAGSSALEPAMAADGITEYFELGLPRVLQRERVDTPSTSLHVHCTDDELDDGAGQWLMWSDDGAYRMTTGHEHGDAALRGRAADILLVLMGRADRSMLDIVGDETTAAAWLDLPGW